jgi:hypothetical protein
MVHARLSQRLAGHGKEEVPKIGLPDAHISDLAASLQECVDKSRKWSSLLGALDHDSGRACLGSEDSADPGEVYMGTIRFGIDEVNLDSGPAFEALQEVGEGRIFDEFPPVEEEHPICPPGNDPNFVGGDDYGASAPLKILDRASEPCDSAWVEADGRLI